MAINNHLFYAQDVKCVNGVYRGVFFKYMLKKYWVGSCDILMQFKTGEAPHFQPSKFNSPVKKVDVGKSKDG